MVKTGEVAPRVRHLLKDRIDSHFLASAKPPCEDRRCRVNLLMKLTTVRPAFLLRHLGSVVTLASATASWT
jgi:hypothetical protein